MRLAELGRRVVVVEKAAFPRSHVGESLAFGVMPLLEVLGLRSAVESAGFLRSSWATVDWASERNRYEVHGGPSLLVDRARFDAILLQAASSLAGVRLYQPARVVRATRVGARWEVALDTGEVVHAKYLAQASGRSRIRVSSQTGALPGTKRAIGPRTLALYAYWRDTADFSVGEQGDTLVEAGREAWYWGAPLPDRTFNATVFVDPGPGGDYEKLLEQSKLLGPRLRNARRLSEIHITDATPFADLVPATSSSIKVGDAGLSIDPLSSQGVQTAIGTALHAALVLNTLMDRPEDTELALDFYRARVRESADFHAAAAADFYLRQAVCDGGDFWRRRVPASKPKASRELPAPSARIARSPHLRFEPVAVAEASHISRRDGLKASGKSYAFVGEEIALAPLLFELDGPMSAFDLVRRWSRRLAPQKALQVLHWAWSEGLIDPERPGP